MRFSTKTRTTGQSAVELVAGVAVVIPLVFVGIDIATLYLGSQMNSGVCRDAARAAASGPPNEIAQGQPYQRAAQVVNRNMKSTGAVRLEPLTQTDVIETLTPGQALPSAPFGGPVSGTIQVKTTVDVYTPFMVGAIIGRTPVKIQATQTFPITWQMATTYTTTTTTTTTTGP